MHEDVDDNQVARARITPRLIESLYTEAMLLAEAAGHAGVGQSSWGPAVYGIVDGEDAGASLAEHVRETLGPSGQVYEGPFRSDGARVWRAQIERSP